MFKTTWISLALVALTFGCAKKQDEAKIEIKPLTAKEIRAVHVSIQMNIPLDEALTMADTCQEFRESLPKNFVQGFVEVPEDYENPNGRKISVFYYGRLEKNKAPVVFYNGGPASDSHGSYTTLEGKAESQKLSFIYVDQRGTGCSDAFPSEPTGENVQRLTHYTSTEIVKDSEVIRAKLLGNQAKWKIFGQSYGGLIVHRYSIVAPESVSEAYAHGFSLMNDQVEWLKRRVQSQKRVLEMYLKSYPQDRETIAQIRSKISEKLCFEDQGTEVCGPKLLDALTIFLGFANTWPRMHQTIQALLDVDGELNMEFLETFVRYYVFGVYNNNGLAGSVISMTEISGGGSDSETCQLINQELAAEGQKPEDWLINECRLLGGMKNDKWNELLQQVDSQGAMTPSQLKASLEKNPKLPFYLYSGEKDVFVPIETFEEEVKELGPRITYRQFPKSGHEGFYTEPQVWADILKH